MHFCKICNYLTNHSQSFNRHLKSNKHIILLNSENTKNIKNTENIENINDNIFKCSFCNKEYVYNSGLLKHKKNCKKKPIDIIIINETKQIKKEYEKELKIKEKELKIMETDLKIKETYLKIKEQEKQNLELQLKNIINVSNNNVTINNINNNVNNINISKLDYLNLNFSKVIDFDTFIDNFTDKYCLTQKQCYTIVENYKSDGIDSYIFTVDQYIKDSAIRQYRDLGILVNQETVVLPFLSPDKSLREYFKKIGKWNRTTNKNKLSTLINLINARVFETTKYYINFNIKQRTKTANGFLKNASYSNASENLIIKYT